MSAKKKAAAKRKKKPAERRKKARTVHVFDEHTSYRDELLARSDLVGFLTKRY
jgi:hypothetical protein